MAKITKVAKTNYDGFYLVSRSGDSVVHSYEGYALCPKDVQSYIDANDIKEINAFSMEAIMYGYF